jgi:hypothetical protein
MGGEHYQNIVGIFKELFTKGLKDNPFLFKAVLTGVIKVAKEDLFSGFNNVTDYGVLDERYSSYFGFTEFEVDELLKDNLEGEDKEKDDYRLSIKRRFNGYTFGD